MRKLVVAALLVTMTVAGCGDDDGTTDATNATDTTAADAATGDAPVSLSGKVNDEGTKDASGASTLEVEADDFYFKPTFIKTTAGQKLTIALKNEGQAAHTFTSTELDVDEEVAPGGTASIEVTVPSAEAVAFFCRFHQGGGMQGAFFTKEGATAGGGGGATDTTVVPAGNGY